MKGFEPKSTEWVFKVLTTTLHRSAFCQFISGGFTTMPVHTKSTGKETDKMHLFALLDFYLNLGYKCYPCYNSHYCNGVPAMFTSS